MSVVNQPKEEQITLIPEQQHKSLTFTCKATAFGLSGRRKQSLNNAFKALQDFAVSLQAILLSAGGFSKAAANMRPPYPHPENRPVRAGLNAGA